MGLVIKSVGESIKNQGSDTFKLLFATNFWMISSMTFVWSLINSLQTVLYLLIAPINFPANIHLANEFIYPLIKLDYVPEGFFSKLLNFSEEL